MSRSGSKRKSIPVDHVSSLYRKHTKTRPTSLKLRLPTSYRHLLPDLLLLDVDRVEYVRRNNPQKSYLYRLCSYILDRSPDEVELYVTSDGQDAEDTDEVWALLENDATDFEPGVYVCKPSNGMRIP